MQKYGNLIRIAEAEKPTARPRELQTIYYSVAEYHALQVVSHQRDGNEADEVAAKLLSVLKKASAIDPRPLARVQWPLAVAAGAVKNAKDKIWIQETIDKTRLIIGASANRTRPSK